MSSIMEKFFNPGSVAVIGASGSTGKPGNVVLRNMLDNGYQGEIFLVNPRGGEIEGRPVAKSIDDLPADIDQAVVTLPAGLVPETVRALGVKGIKAVVLAASGFAEVDEMGEGLQADLAEAIRDSGVRVLGPNTTGHISVPANFTSSFFPVGELRRGSVSYIAQTGNFCGISIRHLLSAENYGVARSCGLGNKVDLNESDILEFYGQDPETKSIFMYLESVVNPTRFLRVARRVSQQKPVFLLKGGASDAGAQAALAHTGSLAADGRIVDGAIEQAGITRLSKYSQLFHVAKALDVMVLPKGNRVSFLSPSGAFTVCLTDVCRNLGLDVPKLEEKTRKRLQDLAPPFIRMRNPVDIFGSVGMHGYEVAYKDALEAVLIDRNIDAVVAILMLTTETGIPDLNFIPQLANRYPAKPIYVTFMGEHKHNIAAKELLEPEGVPCYLEVEQPFEVLSLLVDCRRKMRRA
ncbi:MAG: CoA-binding protein [Rhodospirillaceae bacterium]